MANKRVYFPIHAVIATSFVNQVDAPIHGVQSVNMTTNFNLEQIFELGQLEIYENIENLPDVEMTIERVLDGYPLLYESASEDATLTTLVAKTNTQTDIHLLIYSDDLEESEGSPLTQVTLSGMYMNSLTYTFPVEGNCTESVSFVGNDKVWAVTKSLAGVFGTDSPAAASGVQRREDVLMGSAGSTWPTIIPGINGSGKNTETSGAFNSHLQDVSITVNFNREDLLELGRKKPYFRFVNFPVTIETTINMTAGGTDPGDGVDALSDQDNLIDETIIVLLGDGSIFDVGTKNKLNSVTYSGGDATGGVVTVTYNFQNFNIFDITSP